MTFEELLNKYQTLIVENCNLKDEIVHMNAKLDALEHQAKIAGSSDFAVKGLSKVDQQFVIKTLSPWIRLSLLWLSVVG